MIKLVASICIAAPAATVWARLAQLEEIQVWSPVVVRARCAGAVRQGVGAERTCELVGQRTITERWVAWDEGRSFTYEGVGLPFMRRATNHWAVVAQGEQTLLTSEAELEMKGGRVGRLLERIARPLLRRMAAPALVRFKYYVEQGHPYDGPGAGLPRAAATCA